MNFGQVIDGQMQSDTYELTVHMHRCAQKCAQKFDWRGHLQDPTVSTPLVCIQNIIVAVQYIHEIKILNPK